MKINYQQPNKLSRDRAHDQPIKIACLTNTYKLKVYAALKFELRNNWKMKLKHNIVVNFRAADALL